MQLGEQLEHPVERLQRLVEGLVVGAIHLHELVDAVGVEVAHLGEEARPADGGADALLVRLEPEHGHRRVPHRRDDDRPRVDQSAVEVEEDDRVPHNRDPSPRAVPGFSRTLCCSARAPRSRRVLHVLEVEPPRGRSRAAVRARPALEEPCEPFRSRLEHRPDERSHHVPEEGVGRHREVQVISALLPCGCADLAAEDLVLRLRRGERREVVLAGEDGRRPLERLERDGPRPPQRAARLQGRARRPVEDDVSIRAGDGREARVEAVGSLRHREHAEVGGQRRVQGRRGARPQARRRSRTRSRPGRSREHRCRCGPPRRGRASRTGRSRRAPPPALPRPSGARAAGPSR